MKNTKLMLLLAVVTLTAVSCGSKKETPKEEAPKMLVLYYSQTGNTKAVAVELANKLGADIEEITMVNPYDPDFQATIDRCKKDQEQGILPEI
ncbi:MAG: hypothetical protein K5901_06430, partial [Bacteroidales bacterium]|nr:hypothetical protein [Bacteroidales bacterium]